VPDVANPVVTPPSSPHSRSSHAAASAVASPSPDASSPPSSLVPEAPRRPATRLQHGIRQPKWYIDGTVRYNLLVVNGDGEPSSLADALGDKNWKHAMDLEFSALEKNKTWHLVPYSHGKNIIDCK
jgi:hypothetical protein